MLHQDPHLDTYFGRAVHTLRRMVEGPHRSGTVKLFIANDTHYCRALVAEDGQVISSTMDCFYKKHPISNNPRHWENIYNSAEKKDVIKRDGNLFLCDSSALHKEDLYQLPIETGDKWGRFEIKV